ncbi:TPA: hypothetical protein I8Y95_000967 [Legionella pneumophila]|nr:hypothetical protein [Legionella pneumophila]HAT1762002.1 hypothetical protein [Legionella pneumophila]HAT1811477.1 hypothetical protein [Legionella pneumophila]HAT1815603.1 hypothetical protein [Legionella pneumophila]HAT8718155.1 hypothetical protein [Legionella pneumophila]
MNNQINSDVFFNDVKKNFDKYQVERLCETHFSSFVAHPDNNRYLQCLKRLREHNFDILYEKLKLMYWAVAGLQAEIAYLYIYYESFMKFKTEDNWEQLNLSLMLFSHHHFASVECVYRCWERFTHILNYLHTKNDKKEGYFGDAYKIIKDSGRYSTRLIKRLKSHQKHWDSISGKRNHYSHEYSKLIDGITYHFKISPILDIHGQPIIKSRTEYPPFKSTISYINQEYLYLKEIKKSINCVILDILNQTISNHFKPYP